MIIFETRGVKSALEEGRFMCPQSASDDCYWHKKVARFFTLYFIPINPLGRLGEYVECQTCKGTFLSQVLEYEPQKSRNEFQSVNEEAMRHTMVLIMLADAENDDEELKVVLNIISKHGGNDMSMAELVDYVFEVQRNPESIDIYLSQVIPNLNEHGKENIIKCALAVAAVDGNIDSSELNVIRDMAKAMEMSPAHLKGILSDLPNQKSTFSAN